MVLGELYFMALMKGFSDRLAQPAKPPNKSSTAKIRATIVTMENSIRSVRIP